MAKNQNQTGPEVPTEPAAEEVVAAVLAPEAPANAPLVVSVKARVMRDCVYGLCDAVVEIDAAMVADLAGVVDADPAAVAYAESLAK